MIRTPLLLVVALLLWKTSPTVSQQEEGPATRKDSVGTGTALPPQAAQRLGSLRFRLRSFPSSVVFSRDSKHLVTTEHDGGAAQFWEVASGALIRELPPGAASCVAFSPDGQQFLTGYGYGPLVLWDWATGKKIRQLRDRAGHSVVFTTDGQRAFTTVHAEPAANQQGGSAVVLIDLTSGQEIRRYSGFEHQPQSYLTLAMSPDGAYLAGGDFAGPGGGDAKVIVWRTDTGQELCRVAEPNNVYQLAFADQETLVIGGYERIRLLKVNGGKILRVLEEGARYGVAVDNEGKRLMVAGDKSIRDLRGKLDRKLTHDSLYHGWHAAWSPDGEHVAVTCLRHPYVTMWNVRTGAEVSFGSGHRGPINAVAASPESRWIATGSSQEAKVCLWDAKSGKLTREMKVRSIFEPRLNCFHFSADGSILTVAGSRWDVTTGQLLDTPVDSADGYRLFRSSLSTDGSLQFQVNESTVAVFDNVTGKHLHSLNVPDPKKYAFNDAVLSQDGKTLASAWFQNRGAASDVPLDSIVLWDARTGKRLSSFRPGGQVMRRLLFAPEGEHLIASAHPGNLEIWHLPTRSLRAKLAVPWGNNRELTGFAIARHGQLLVTQAKGCIQLWEIATGQLVHSWTVGYTDADSATFSADSRHVISGHSDGTALVWNFHDNASAPLGKDAKVWEDLASDPRAAYAVLWKLAQDPVRAVSLLKDRLQAAPQVQFENLERWIRDLGEPMFERRDNAHKHLLKTGLSAVPALRQAANTDIDLETRRRIQRLLETLDGNTPFASHLRDMRAVQLLELVGGAEAKRVLTALSQGDRGHPKSVAATAALMRLEQR